MDECRSSWRCGHSALLDFGLASTAAILVDLVLPLVHWIHQWDLFHNLAFAVLNFMHILLQRYCECHPQRSCIFAYPICGRIRVNIFTFLQTSESFRASLSCVLLLADRRDILLFVTERRLDIQLSSWSVVTPPLAAWSGDRSDGAEAD